MRTLSSWLIEAGVKDADRLRGSNNLIIFWMANSMRRSTNRASRQVSVKQLAWQPDRLRQQGMTRPQPKSQPPTSASWYRPKMEQQGSSNNTQNTGFWSRQRSTTDGKQEPHVVCRDREGVLEFNINTFHHVHLNLTHGSTLISTVCGQRKSKKETERQETSTACRSITVVALPFVTHPNNFVGFRKHTLGGPRNEARKESRKQHERQENKEDKVTCSNILIIDATTWGILHIFRCPKRGNRQESFRDSLTLNGRLFSQLVPELFLGKWANCEIALTNEHEGHYCFFASKFASTR